MLQSQLQRRRPLAGIFWILLIAGGVALALVNLYAGLLLIALGALVALAMTRTNALAVPRAAVARPAPRQALWAAAEQRVLADASGAARPAIVVHRDAESGYETVLTSEGYALVNRAGERVLPLGR